MNMSSKPSGLTKRTRASGPKVRTGCITCKIRRVKCDEGKPECLRCKSTGRKCDGYLENEPTQSRIVPVTASSSSSTALSTYLLSVEFDGDDQERICFHFFRTVTAQQLSGFFESEFWNRMVLQAVYFEPAFRHAAIALGAIHSRAEIGEMAPLKDGIDGIEGDFSLQHYNKAIRNLLVPPPDRRQQPTDVALTCSLLFTCFELLRDNPIGAFTHISSGLKILTEEFEKRKEPQSSQTPILPRNLYFPLEIHEHIFTRLDTQVSEILHNRVTPRRSWGVFPVVSDSFSSLHDARESWDYLHNQIVHYVQLCEEYTIEEDDMRKEEKSILQNLILQWSATLDAFLQSEDTKLSVKDDQGAAVLKIYRIITAIMLQESNYNNSDMDEMIWDKYMPDYMAAIDLAETVFATWSDQTSLAEPNSLTPRFSLDTGIIQPLCQVATRCRHPIVRRKAISLMRSANLREGLWQSSLCATIVQKIVDVEEQGLDVIVDCVSIPKRSRIRDLAVTKFSVGERRAIMRLSYEPTYLWKRFPSSYIEEEIVW